MQNQYSPMSIETLLESATNKGYRVVWPTSDGTHPETLLSPVSKSFGVLA